MSQDYETKQSDLRASRDEPGGDRPAAEDPLVELARIVHKNKQSGANVSSGRVGSTDYFAGLEDVAVDPVAPANPDQVRQEPTFAPVAPVVAAPVAPVDEIPSPSEPIAPADPTPPGLSLGDLAQASQPTATPEAGQSSHVSSLWPDIHANEPQETAAAPTHVPVAPVEPEAPRRESSPGQVAPFERVAANDQTSLSPTLSIDLEQNLTAELEDELIGALRQSVDDTQPVSTPQPTAPSVDSRPEQSGFAGLPDSFGKEFEAGLQQHTPEVLPADSYRVEPAPAPAPAVSVPASEVIRPAETQPGSTPFPSAVNEAAAASSHATSSFAPEEPSTTVPGFNEPVQPVEPVSPETASRPRIDENDLFAALNPAAAAPTVSEPVAPQHGSGEPAGIDALFADLDFPPPGDRNAAQSPTVQEPTPAPAPEPDPLAGASDIDDMTWPAAAAEVPQTDEEDDTPPPPEGYDLDAVARAMQESDPSLTGAGVLPPHSAAEKEAVPQAKEKSRRGLFVAAGVMGVAVLGAAGFFLVDGDGVVVPSGPPPVISGLQEPLKIYPEESPAPADSQTTKMIYDRVNENNGSAPSNLVLPETPQPAELPPAPAGTNNGAELVPGAPKRVRTVIVRPDGTIVSEDDPAAPAAAVPAPATTPAPATPEPAAPATPANSDASRVVATTPITGTPEPVAPAATPEPAAPTPAVSETPAIVAGTGEPTAGQTDAQPPAEIVSVTPRKKPNAPVQVASAPPVATTPAPAAQNSGPLNLNQTASAPAATPAPAGNTGTIASGTYIVQVTSQRSAAAASDAYSGLQRRFPAILGNRNAVIVAANVQDRGVFYRARIPTTSRDEAISLCENLQAAGGDCFVRRQP